MAAGLLSEYTGKKVELGGRLARLAGQTTNSLPALKAYLEGEVHFRHASYRRASEAFQSAVAMDSTFALAWYRLSVSEGWFGNVDVQRKAARQAVRLSDRLPPHDQDLLNAYLAGLRGDHAESERLCRLILSTYPEDSKAWSQLGETLFHGNCYRGRSMVEAREALERTLFLDPENLEALDHLTAIAAHQRQWASFDSLITLALPLVSESQAIEWNAVRVFALGDSSGQERVIAELRGELGSLGRVSQAVAVYVEDLALAEHLIRLSGEAEYSLGFPYLMVARGRWRAAQSEIEKLEPNVSIASRAWLTTIPFVPTSKSELQYAREAVSRWIPAVGDTSHPDWWTKSLVRMYPQVQRYLLGLLDLRLGRHESALAFATELEQMDDPPEAPDLPRDYALSLRAQVALQRGHPKVALGLLEHVFVKVPWPPLPWKNGLHERYLRAELLSSLGRDEEALGWYAGLSELQMMELPYRAVSHLRRAEIYEGMDQPDKAIHHYSRFIELWKDCDPELRPMVDDARARMERLMAASG